MYACDHFCEPRYRLGNLRDRPLTEMAGSERQQRFGAAKRDTLARACRACSVRWVCNGECPKNRFSSSAKNPGLNVLCEGYKAFFTHVNPAMQFMAAAIRAGRPPAEIMAHLI